VIIDPNRVSRVLLPVSGRIVSVLAALGAVVDGRTTGRGRRQSDADAAVATYLQGQAAERQATSGAGQGGGGPATGDRAATERGAVATKDLLGARNDLTQAQGAAEAARAAREQGRRRLELLGLKPGEIKQPILVRAPSPGR
jgi:cobalt-zinc-cadmium efflux system membrane fusion protein